MLDITEKNATPQKENIKEESCNSEVCAKNANVPLVTNPEKDPKNPDLGDKNTIWHNGTLTQSAQTNGKTFSDQIARSDWPAFCLPILDSQPDTVGKDKMMLGSLNIISGLLPKTIFSIYDRRRIYAPLYNVLYGGFATRKGDLEACKQLVAPLKDEMRRNYEIEMMEYQQEMMGWEGAPTSLRGLMPQEPILRSPLIPANSSTAAIYRALDANGGWGIMFETEADTLSNMLTKTEYGNYSDLLRKAHHHETVSMKRVNDHLDIELEEPRLSVLLTCTGSQLPILLPPSNIANGLASRILFYDLPNSSVEFRDVFKDCDKPIEAVYKELGQKLLVLYHALKDREKHPIQFLMTPQQKKEFLSTFSDMLHEQFAMLGDGIQGFIYRLALQCYRYAMVLTVIRRLSERIDSGDKLFDDDEQALICDDRDFRTAMAIINCLVNHTGRVYAIIGGYNCDPFTKTPPQMSKEMKTYFEALPDEDKFRTAEAMEIAEASGIPQRTAKRMLGDMVNKHLVLDHPRHGIYRKIKMEEQDL